MIVGVSVACNSQTESNKVKLLTEYESVIQNVLLPIELIFQNAKQLQHARPSWHIRGLKIIGHKTPDNNLESLCIFM
jgi:hypothetical protein